MRIEFLKTKNEVLDFPVSLIIYSNYEIVNTNMGKFLKIPLDKDRNKRSDVLSRLFEISFTSEWMYIPMKYIKEIQY